MTPSPQETIIEDKMPTGKSTERPLTGEEVVISGMSGIFPKSDSVLEFEENLFNKVDMVTEPRWNFSHPEVPKHLGVVNGMTKFDAQFFRVHYKQACTMDPMSRKLLEHAYSAIFDSGINPLQLRGKKVGVFIGSSFSEQEKIGVYETFQRNGFSITGCNKAMYANRISYWIDGKGPSYALDLTCASSMACLEHAYRSISTGQCEAAIIGGCNLCIHPYVSLNFKRAGLLCLDGKTKCFDKSGDGYVRSEAISVLFLQKAKDAKRIYSQVYYAMANYSLRSDSEFLPIRQSKDIEEFLKEFYSGIDVSPSEVEYVEACGSAIAEADGNELEAIGNIFGKDKPIKVGSVKSNMGSSEPASGACALTKVCLAYHKGQLPANLHYNEPQLHIPSVREGRVEILKENSAFNRSFTALNTFSYSGANIHVLLKGHFKPKKQDRYQSSVPHLILASGRQESCVNKILNTLKNQPIDFEQIGLLHNIFKSNIPGHMCRGYSILDLNDKKETVCLAQKIEYVSEESHPIWFVYSGMGSQWAGMGTELMRIPTFAAAIERCHKVLEPKGLNIINILTQPDKTIYDNILNSFVGIAAVQIGLTDVLRELGIVPDNIIGHSVGELGCGYADGCFTAEEMILSAYSRGLVSTQTPFIRGSMAAVGLGYKDILPLCPPKIEVACHNSAESSTLSGPADVMTKFVKELTDQGIFAKEVPCSNIAYHSRYIASAGPGLLKYLTEVIKNPKPRSEKWVSSSVPKEKWSEAAAKYSSAEYHTNNLLYPVLFEETASLIPENALVIEIAPHGLLQAILKRSHNSCIHVPLTRRGHSNPIQFFLEAVGKLYQIGLNPKVDCLYPKIEFPVSTETPLLSHLVEWEHNEDWHLVRYTRNIRRTTIARKVLISVHDQDYKYLSGHMRDDVQIFSEAAILVLVWETLAMHKGIDYRNMPVKFQNVQFHEEAFIKEDEPLRLGIMIQKGNGKFEVNQNGVEIVSGTIDELRSSGSIFSKVEDTDTKEDDGFSISADDFYKILCMRGFTYKDDFKLIQSSNSTQKSANIKWNHEWVKILDSLIQFDVFARNHNGISVPKLIKKVTIDTQVNQQFTEGKNLCTAIRNKVLNRTCCAGVEIDTLIFEDKPTLEKEPDVIESQSFIPHVLYSEIDMDASLLIILQIIADNVGNKLNITAIDGKFNEKIMKTIKTVSDKIPNVDIEINTIISKESTNIEELQTISKSNVFIVDNLLGNELNMKNMNNIISKNSFILTYEDNTRIISPKYKYFNVIATMPVQKKVVVLLNKVDTESDKNDTYIMLNCYNDLSWIARIKCDLNKTRRIVLVSERRTYYGALGLVKELNKYHPNKVGMIVIDDDLAPAFDPKLKYYKDQIEKRLNFNVLKKDQWGGYYYLPREKVSNLCNIKLSCTVPGDINSLTWIEALPSPASSTKVQVCYAGPSFRDAQKAVRKVNNDNNKFGMDFSGIDSQGQRVMGAIAEGAMSSTVEADINMLWPVPKHWSLEDAATVPLPYIHAYYCLANKNSALFRNYSVFVNCGAGAFGQAVISICLAENCEVYTTVSNIQKKTFLMRLFPDLKGKNISCSRNDSFYYMVLKNTEGKGCDFAINSLSGSLRKAAMKCVGSQGIFMDVSDSDMIDNKDFEMSYLCKEKNYRAVNVSNLFCPKNVKQRMRIQAFIAEGIAKGTVRPLSRVVYSPKDVTRAFRLLATSQNRGRVLIEIREPSMNQTLQVKPAMQYSPVGSYVVVCDEKGLAIQLVDRLVSKGAKQLLLSIKQSLIDGYFCTKLESWRKQNVTVVVSQEKLQTEKDCNKLLEQGSKLAPIEGIFIIIDSAKASFEQDSFEAKFNETGAVVANLDLVSRNDCPELKHFLVLIHASENLIDSYITSAIDQICATRNETSLPALVLHVDKYEFNPNADGSEIKHHLQTLSSVFNALEISLKLKYNNVITFDVKKPSDDNYLNKLARILGAENIEDIPQDVPLQDFTITDVNLDVIKTIMETAHKTKYPKQILQTFTLHRIKTLGESEKRNTKLNSGLGAFYTFIDEDECLATEPILSMPTKLSYATEKEEELDPKETYLMLIPGFEGHHQILQTICERVKVLAMVFQLGPDVLNCSIKQMAFNIMKLMKNRFELGSKFYLLGYSFGVNVALELTNLLEEEGHAGVVFCLDSSPDALRVHLDAYLGNLSDTKLQNTITEHMYRLMAGKDSKELKEELENLENWNDKVEACVNKLRGLVNYSHQYKRSILESAYSRIKLARDYKPNLKLKSEIVLLKGIPYPDAKKLPEDYNLSQYTDKVVKIHYLNADHATAINDCRVSNFINSYLEPNFLEEFKNKNLCETYLIDPIKSV